MRLEIEGEVYKFADECNRQGCQGWHIRVEDEDGVFWECVEDEDLADDLWDEMEDRFVNTYMRK